MYITPPPSGTPRPGRQFPSNKVHLIFGIYSNLLCYLRQGVGLSGMEFRQMIMEVYV